MAARCWKHFQSSNFPQVCNCFFTREWTKEGIGKKLYSNLSEQIHSFLHQIRPTSNAISKTLSWQLCWTDFKYTSLEVWGLFGLSLPFSSATCVIPLSTLYFGHFCPPLIRLSHTSNSPQAPLILSFIHSIPVSPPHALNPSYRPPSPLLSKRPLLSCPCFMQHFSINRYTGIYIF